MLYDGYMFNLDMKSMELINIFDGEELNDYMNYISNSANRPEGNTGLYQPYDIDIYQDRMEVLSKYCQFDFSNDIKFFELYSKCFIFGYEVTNIELNEIGLI